MSALIFAQPLLLRQDKNPWSMTPAEVRQLEIKPCVDKAVAFLSTRKGQVAFCAYTIVLSKGKEPYLHWGAIGSSWLWHLLLTSPQSKLAPPKFILDEFMDLSMAYARFRYVPPSLKPIGHNIICETLFALPVGDDLFLAYASKHPKVFNVAMVHRQFHVADQLISKELESENKKGETPQEASRSFGQTMKALRRMLVKFRKDVVKEQSHVGRQPKQVAGVLPPLFARPSWPRQLNCVSARRGALFPDGRGPDSPGSLPFRRDDLGPLGHKLPTLLLRRSGAVYSPPVAGYAVGGGRFLAFYGSRSVRSLSSHWASRERAETTPTQRSFPSQA